MLVRWSELYSTIKTNWKRDNELIMFKVGIENNLSIIKDPFTKKGVSSIHMHSYPKNGSLEWTASIEFVNGQTEGKQKFRGNDFEQITMQMKSFIESLSN